MVVISGSFVGLVMVIKGWYIMFVFGKLIDEELRFIKSKLVELPASGDLHGF